MGIIKRLYLCDMLKVCSAAPGCSRNGGECRHTAEMNHARNGAFTIEEKDGTLVTPDNVDILKFNDGNIVLIEKEAEKET